MTGTYGNHQRATPKLQILRGEISTSPKQRSRQFAPKADEGILSGHIISYSAGDTAWVKGMGGGGMPYIALVDQTDFSVLGSGELTGLSLADPRRLQTCFFVAGTYAPGQAITWATGGDAGKIKEAATSDTIIGYVTENGKVDIADRMSGVVTDAGQILVVEFDTVFNRTASL